ncbi:MAG: PDZ domain-containing protein [Patescibacteria group bacterium]|jgi:S1-C subfamily serine protease
MPKTSEANNRETKRTVIDNIYNQEILRPSSGGGILGIKNLLLILVVSVLGGFVAGLVQDNWFSVNDYLSPAASEQVAKSKEVLDLNFLVKEDTGSYDKIFSEIRKQLVGFYRLKTPTSAGSGILDSLYLEKDFLGSGVVATSDGWLMVPAGVVGDNKFIVVTSDKKIYQPDKQILDKFSNILLVHISATGLSPVKFASVSAISPTDLLLTSRYSIQNHGSDIVKTSIQKFAYHDQAKPADFLLSTDKIDHYLKLAKELAPVYNGAMLLNDKNEVAGLLFNSGREGINLAIPAYYLKSAIGNFLANSEEVLRSRLGVNYLDLSEALGLNQAVAEGRVKGAVLLGDAKRNILAVIDGSPAALAGLAAGDIILKVNNEDIDESNSLTKLIQDYSSGQEITLRIFRKGEEKDLKVTLGEL